MVRWDDVLAEHLVSLEFVNVDLKTGEFSAIVTRSIFENEKGCETWADINHDKLAHEGTLALERFFACFGIEFRDVVAEMIERQAPLEPLVKLIANLCPADPVTPLSEVLTDEVVDKLESVGRPYAKTLVRATMEPIRHRGLLANWGVTLHPMPDSPPLKPLASYEEAISQEDGTIYFVLDEPFSTERHVEVDLRAIELGTILMEVALPEA